MRTRSSTLLLAIKRAISPSILSEVGKRVSDGIHAIAQGPTFT